MPDSAGRLLGQDSEGGDPRGRGRVGPILLWLAGIAIAGGMMWEASRMLRPARRMVTAGESSHIASMLTLITAQEQYRSIMGGGYATLPELSATTPPFIDNVLGRGKKSGYLFFVKVTPDRRHWYGWASPVTPFKTGIRYFYFDDTGVVRFAAGRPAGAGDEPLER